MHFGKERAARASLSGQVRTDVFKFVVAPSDTEDNDCQSTIVGLDSNNLMFFVKVLQISDIDKQPAT